MRLPKRVSSLACLLAIAVAAPASAQDSAESMTAQLRARAEPGVAAEAAPRLCAARGAHARFLWYLASATAAVDTIGRRRRPAAGASRSARIGQGARKALGCS